VLGETIDQGVLLLLVGCFVVGTAIFIEKNNDGKPGDYHYQALANRGDT
jgi:hypothetical protein